jgi:hypothetical protein
VRTYVRIKILLESEGWKRGTWGGGVVQFTKGKRYINIQGAGYWRLYKGGSCIAGKGIDSLRAAL